MEDFKVTELAVRLEPDYLVLESIIQNCGSETKGMLLVKRTTSEEDLRTLKVELAKFVTVKEKLPQQAC
jgi:hypothetical protein